MCVYRALLGCAGRDPQKRKREGCVRQKGRKRLRRDAHQPQRQRGRRLPDERGRLRRADARFRRRADFHRPKRRVQREDQGLAGHDDVRDVRAKEKETERPLTDCRQKAKFKFLGTGVISVTPVPLLAVRPRECILAPIVTGYAHIFVHGFSTSAHSFSAVIFAFIKKSLFHLRKK
jgi:hypothetical protein